MAKPVVGDQRIAIAIKANTLKGRIIAAWIQKGKIRPEPDKV